MFELRPIGYVASPLGTREAAPRQGDEGAPHARIAINSDVCEAAADLHVGDEILILTWLHQGSRDTLAVHPRADASRPKTGVFSTRSPDRPNPIGLHRVTVVEKTETTLTVSDLEAIDGTPVIDIKPVIGDARER